MSKNAWAYTDEKDDRVPEVPEAPEGQVQDDSYVTKTNEPIPVTGDNANIADPMKPKNADSDKQLEADDREAIDKSNMLESETRGAKLRESYKEPTDDKTWID
ncbi:unnamed protein product [Clonostachys chloroleuca]|uniref:Uncharacterized protein n=1 Tax=Clonostachys chloroleuca TaxID=1926264 RepID=A0AA35LUD9_9HYPO|nr:unnamed protein product [Clonostachys chloroleuca]